MATHKTKGPEALEWLDQKYWEFFMMDNQFCKTYKRLHLIPTSSLKQKKYKATNTFLHIEMVKSQDSSILLSHIRISDHAAKTLGSITNMPAWNFTIHAHTQLTNRNGFDYLDSPL